MPSKRIVISFHPVPFPVLMIPLIPSFVREPGSQAPHSSSSNSSLPHCVELYQSRKPLRMFHCSIRNDLSLFQPGTQAPLFCVHTVPFPVPSGGLSVFQNTLRGD